ncbi:MAG TPA: hypothetical protein VM925_26805 [Labilithrix sp.]|nr:hypothetical protein [Labilithrix sp.]
MQLSARYVSPVLLLALVGCHTSALDGGTNADAGCDASSCAQQDGGTDAGGVDQAWDCLGSVPPAPNVERRVPVQQSMRLVSWGTGTPLSGLPVKACSQLDVQCGNPFGGTSTQTDTNGRVDLVLYSGFRGYLDFAPSTSTPSLLPGIVYFVPIPDKNATDGALVSHALLHTADLESIAATGGNPIAAEYGHFAFRAVDCQGNGAAGVTVVAETVTDKTFSVYMDSSGTPVSTGSTSTDGRGVFVNLPSGSIGMTLMRDGKRIGMSNVIIRPQSISYSLLVPFP